MNRREAIIGLIELRFAFHGGRVSNRQTDSQGVCPLLAMQDASGAAFAEIIQDGCTRDHTGQLWCHFRVAGTRLTCGSAACGVTVVTTQSGATDT